LLKASLVHVDAALRRYFLCDFKREAKRVIQHESLSTWQNGLLRATSAIAMTAFPRLRALARLAITSIAHAAGEQLVEQSLALFQSLDETVLLAL
jgi:hypothetical protein